MAEDTCFAITLVHGAAAATHANQLKDHYSAERAVTSTDDVQSGDLVLLEDLDGLEWLANNVLLLPGNRAPIVRLVPLADALAELGS